MLVCWIETVGHKEQRYNTVGDWTYKISIKDVHCIEVRVSRLGDWRYELLVGVHELIEAALCKHRGISEQAVTDFDKAFENVRQEGDDREPGDIPGAPYHREHFFATSVERLLAAELDVDWTAYDDAIGAL